MAIALDRIAYFGERLSENIAQTPEGYLICRNAVIGRSGFQNYKVSELSDPDGELEKRYSPSDEIAVWRDPSEVFSQATIASFEGKPFTLTHPSELLDPDNTSEHSEGHIQNVRRGDPLPDGNIPLIADIVVTGRSAIRAVETGERELSCGYTYRLAHEGERWDQREIQGNHVALVQKGRAGDLARINDAAPKEKRTVKSIKELLGLGIKELSKTASAEEVADAARLVANDDADEKERKTAADTNVGPTSIRILDEPPKKNGAVKGKFVQIGDKFFKLVGVDDDDDHKGMDEEEEKKKMAADDKMRKGLHDALDALFKSKSSGDDSAFDAFKKQLDAYIEGGSKATDDDDDKKSAKDDDDDKKHGKDKVTEHEAAEMDDDEEEEEKEKEKSEDSEIVRPEPVLGLGEPPKNALDEKMLRVIVADANLTMLKMLKPLVAHANDKTLNAAFDTLTKKLKGVMKDSTPNKNGYGEFRVAASTLSSEARDSKDWKPRKSEAETRNEAIDKMFADVMARRGNPFSDRMKERMAGGK